MLFFFTYSCYFFLQLKCNWTFFATEVVNVISLEYCFSFILGIFLQFLKCHVRQIFFLLSCRCFDKYKRCCSRPVSTVIKWKPHSNLSEGEGDGEKPILFIIAPTLKPLSQVRQLGEWKRVYCPPLLPIFYFPSPSYFKNILSLKLILENTFFFLFF